MSHGLIEAAGSAFAFAQLRHLLHRNPELVISLSVDSQQHGYVQVEIRRPEDAPDEVSVLCIGPSLADTVGDAADAFACLRPHPEPPIGPPLELNSENGKRICTCDRPEFEGCALHP